MERVVYMCICVCICANNMQILGFGGVGGVRSGGDTIGGGGYHWGEGGVWGSGDRAHIYIYIYIYTYIMYNCHGSSTETSQSKSRNIVSTCLDPTPGPPRIPDIFHGEGSEFEENSTGRSLKLHLESHQFLIQGPPRSRGGTTSDLSAEFEK